MNAHRSDLDAARLAAGVAPPWRSPVVLDEIDSTNRTAVAAARAGEPEGLVVIADRQTAGRGRLGRRWLSPAGAGIAVSVVLRPSVPDDRLGWLPLLAGLSVQAAVARCTGLPLALKWPNDVYGSRGKLAGLLSERVAGGAVVVGVGLNVHDLAGLPEGATSVAAEGVDGDRTALLLAVLDELGTRYGAWVASGGAPEAVRPDYRAVCRTIGAAVRVELPGGGVVVGDAVDVDGLGRLVVLDGSGQPHHLASGDVVHVRPAG
ncbi:MAG TPA: biotin--[acetyl-CoA-carboxylase] ligase [Mycobacteriales bacterium]|nr:biotin--[acetyl-CoA-carboxylase] ligase [Mycobacteriales bacterium]